VQINCSARRSNSNKSVVYAFIKQSGTTNPGQGVTPIVSGSDLAAATAQCVLSVVAGSSVECGIRLNSSAVAGSLVTAEDVECTVQIKNR
jgi:hypothetical protein